MISPTSPTLKPQVGNFIFRAIFLDDFQGRIMARFAYQISKREKYVRLLIKASDIVSAGKVFRRKNYQAGGVICLKKLISVRFRFQCATYQYRAKNPDAIYIPAITRRPPDRTTSAQVQH